jgi:hypothetical protein
MNHDKTRISQLELSIREGEARLKDNKQTGKESIRIAVRSAKIRIERLGKCLPEGGMMWNGERWIYEYHELSSAE